MDEFAEALDLADKVYLCDILVRLGKNKETLRLKTLERKSKGGEVIKENNVSPLLDYHDAVVIFMGAGDVQNLNKRMKNF